MFKNIYCLIFNFIMSSPQHYPFRQAQNKFGEGAKGKICLKKINILIFFSVNLFLN